METRAEAEEGKESFRGARSLDRGAHTPQRKEKGRPSFAVLRSHSLKENKRVKECLVLFLSILKPFHWD